VYGASAANVAYHISVCLRVAVIHFRAAVVANAVVISVVVILIYVLVAYSALACLGGVNFMRGLYLAHVANAVGISIGMLIYHAAKITYTVSVAVGVRINSANIAFAVGVIVLVHQRNATLVANAVAILVRMLKLAAAFVTFKVSVFVPMLITAVRGVRLCTMIAYVVSILVVVIKAGLAFVADLVRVGITVQAASADITGIVAVCVLVGLARRRELLATHVAQSVFVFVVMFLTFAAGGNRHRHGKNGKQAQKNS
jgi:hypothetical protein